MKNCIYILFILLTNVGFSQRIPVDKREHFFAGVAIGSTAATINTGWHPLINSVVAGTGAGILKETYDAYHKGGVVDKGDIYFGVTGSVIGGAATYFINKAIHNRQKKRRDPRWL